MPREIPMSIAEYKRLIAGGYQRVIPEETARQGPVALPPDERPDARLLAQIQRWTKQYSWRGLHTFNAHGDDEGLHVILVREAVIFAEVKTPHAKLTESQHVWLEALRQAGTVEVYVWRPQDAADIQARLSRKVAR